MTNTLKCGYSLGTKHSSSLTRVGRITLILFLPLGKHSSWVQIDLEFTLLRTLPGKQSHGLKYCCGQARTSVHIYVLAYMSSSLCI